MTKKLKDPTTPYTISAMPTECRADQRLRTVGAQNLSTSELLTIIIGKGTNHVDPYRRTGALLQHTSDLLTLAQMSDAELMDTALITRTEADRIRAAIELGRRAMCHPPAERPQILKPADAATIFMLDMIGLTREEVRVMHLDNHNHVERIITVYRGSLNSASIRIAEMFQDAVRHNCAAMIVAHNHPSGDPTPSFEDCRINEILVDAGKLLDITVRDHIVVGRNRWVSMKERGLGFR